MKKILDFLGRQPKPTILWFGIASVVLIGCVNHLAGVEISFSILYLLPVSLVSWFVGRREGGVIAMASSVSWYVAEWYANRNYSNPIIYYWNLTVMFGFFFIVNFSLSRLKNALEKEKKLARVDSLTGVANSRFFFDLAEREVERSRRYRHPLTLLYLDCDNFKRLNDRFGHQIGNRLLHLLAINLQDNTRTTDIVARLGGDEFAVLMPETGEQVVPLAIQRLHARLVEVLLAKGWPVTLSMGAAVYLHPPASADELIKSADRLMLQAKNEGKNTVRYRVFSNPEASPGSPLPADPSTRPPESLPQESNLPVA